MRAPDVHEMIADMRHEVIEDLVSRCIPQGAYAEQWSVDTLHEACLRLLALDLPIADWAKEEGIADREILERVRAASNRKMAQQDANYGPDIMPVAEPSLWPQP